MSKNIRNFSIIAHPEEFSMTSAHEKLDGAGVVI